MYEINNLNFSYGEKDILNNISLKIVNGNIISILGPNGSGKTTLLKLLLGILSPNSGEILFNSQKITKINSKKFSKFVAYIPQIHENTFGYTVEDIVLMGRMPHKKFFSNFNAQDIKIASEALEILNIECLKNEIFSFLSGGQKQMVLIARAIAQKAKVFIMDEPVNGLDFGNQYRLLDKIKSLSGQGITFIKTSHYPDHVFYSSDEAIFIDKGKILAKGTPTDIINSKIIKKVYDVNSVITEISNRKVCIAI